MIYTAITGNKDPRREDIICFSSYKKFKDDMLNAKVYKVLSHYYDSDLWSIWIDGNLKLKVPEEKLIELAQGHEITVFKHPYRNTVYEEFEELIDRKLDDVFLLRDQMKRYKSEGFKGDKLSACYLIIRKHTDNVKRKNEKWMSEILIGSKRDQCSFDYCFPEVFQLPRLDGFDNEYFTRQSHY